MHEMEYVVKFTSGDLAEANKFAEELREAILEEAANKDVELTAEGKFKLISEVYTRI